MAQLLLEFFCEEIPARMQARAENDLERLLTERLKTAGLGWESLQTFSGPRRLGLVIEGLPAKTEDVREERKGPKVGAPDKAIEGFLRSAGLESLDQCKIEEGKKGAFYIALIEKPGQDTASVIGQAIPEIAKAFPWPKSMKFARDGVAQRWVRPLQRIIALFDGQIVDTQAFGIKAGATTQGHRIHGGEPFTVSDFADYEAKLRDNGVTLTRDERREAILTQAQKVCADAGLKLVDDKGLLEEVTGLVEYPVAILGDMDPAFLDLPPEVIQLTMKTHQKYFAVEDADGKITSKFVVIANQDAPDGGKAIAEGNARVLSARLSDARHFWDLDRAKGLEAMASELSKVTFHEKLGSVADKVERVAALAQELAPSVGADPELASLAAKLAKADLVSQMVYEFPELQGAMGRYYALEADPSRRAARAPQDEGKVSGKSTSPQPEESAQPASKDEGGLPALSAEDRAAVADAIKDHYKPQGPSDAVPTAPVSAAVALADKLDTLVGFWAIDEKPTGSKDPFALRRAALGVIRVLLEGERHLLLHDTLNSPISDTITFIVLNDPQDDQTESDLRANGQDDAAEEFFQSRLAKAESAVRQKEELVNTSLLAFFADRLKVHLKDEGIRHDVIDAVFALGDDDLVRVTAKSRALQAFLNTDDGTALLAGYRRAANILGKEEAKDGERYDGAPDAEYLAGDLPAEERALVDAVEAAITGATTALETEDFEAAMAALSQLRAPVDAFFEAVVVNDERPIVRRNRLMLLSRIRAAADAVADFSRLEGEAR